MTVAAARRATRKQRKRRPPWTPVRCTEPPEPAGRRARNSIHICADFAAARDCREERFGRRPPLQPEYLRAVLRARNSMVNAGFTGQSFLPPARSEQCCVATATHRSDHEHDLSDVLARF